MVRTGYGTRSYKNVQKTPSSRTKKTAHPGGGERPTFFREWKSKTVLIRSWLCVCVDLGCTFRVRRAKLESKTTGNVESSVLQAT